MTLPASCSPSASPMNAPSALSGGSEWFWVPWHTHRPSCFRSLIAPCVVCCKRSWGFAVVSAGLKHRCLRLAVEQNQSH